MKKRKEKKGNKGCAKISIDVNPQVYESQYISLSNDHNQSRLIDLLSEHLINAGQQVTKINGDVDILILFHN